MFRLLGIHSSSARHASLSSCSRCGLHAECTSLCRQWDPCLQGHQLFSSCCLTCHHSFRVQGCDNSLGVTGLARGGAVGYL